MTLSNAARSLNRSFDFARVRPEKTEMVSNRIRDEAGARSTTISVERPTGPPIEVEVWLEHADKRVKLIWLNDGNFPEKVVSKEEMALIRATHDVYFERYDRRKRQS